MSVFDALTKPEPKDVIYQLIRDCLPALYCVEGKFIRRLPDELIPYSGPIGVMFSSIKWLLIQEVIDADRQASMRRDLAEMSSAEITERVHEHEKLLTIATTPDEYAYAYFWLSILYAA
jgi:hypothetical protein